MLLTELRELAAKRDAGKRATEEIWRLLREADLTDVSPSDLAKAAGLTRQRVLNIRNGQR